MSLLVKNRPKLPSLMSDFFETGNLFPSILDFEKNLLDMNGTSLMIPNANILENEKEYVIELAAPGLERKDFKVEIENDMLTISAEKEEEKNEKNQNFRRREFSYHTFSRSFALPENLVRNSIDAKYDKGVLHLTLPKKEVTVSKPAKQIKVS